MPCAYPPPCPWCLCLRLVSVPDCPCPMSVLRGIHLVGWTAAPRCKEHLSPPARPRFMTESSVGDTLQV